MDESEDFNTTAERAAEASFKKRPRKKHLYSQILQQMEFYFSDANLARDRFLSQLLQQHKNVPLDVFLRFNKIRALNCNIEDLAKALATSQLLKVTEDGKNVYRTSAVQKKKDQDDCIIYVEQLPPDANHDWVIGIFSAYGKVEYVSIPKYKNRAAIKGFAFVEFDTPEAAKKALEAFGSVGCCLPPQMPPEELCSIATFEKDDTEANADTAIVNEEDEITEKQKKKQKRNEKNLDETNESIEHAVEQEKHPHCEMEDTEEPKSKKLKIVFDEHRVAEIQKKDKKRDKADNDNTHISLEDCLSDGEAEGSMKTKKSKKRKMEEGNAVISGMSSFDVEEDNDSQIKKKRKKKKHLEEERNTDDVKREQLKIGVGTEETEALTSKGKSSRKMKKRQHDVGSEDGEDKNEEMEVMEESEHYSEFLKMKRKKKCEEHDGESDGDSEPEEAEDEGITKRTKKQTGEVEEDEDNEADDNEKSSKKKRTRKRSKNKKKNIEKKENDPTSLGLRIISKNEWRRLRNKYLNLQREKMHALKKHLARAKFGSNYQSPYPSGENYRQEVKQESKNSEKTEYVPGVIVHIELSEPLGDVKGFKANAKLHQGVKYVDANEGDTIVYIRCISAEVAQKQVAEQLWDNSKILKGKAENAYWEKIWQDRQNKIDKKIKVNVRGKDKLLKRAERELGKHIKFDD